VSVQFTADVWDSQVSICFGFNGDNFFSQFNHAVMISRFSVYGNLGLIKIINQTTLAGSAKLFHICCSYLRECEIIAYIINFSRVLKAAIRKNKGEKVK